MLLNSGPENLISLVPGVAFPHEHANLKRSSVAPGPKPHHATQAVTRRAGLLQNTTEKRTAHRGGPHQRGATSL